MGILINTGFDLGSSSPIDNRTLKDTIDERDALVSEGKVYENLKVYCKDTQKEYRWTGTEWEEVGTGGTVDLSGYAKTYTSLTELGLTTPTTAMAIYKAMPKYTTFLYSVYITNIITGLPDDNGLLEITKGGDGSSSRGIMTFTQSAGNTDGHKKKWVGEFKANNTDTSDSAVIWHQLAFQSDLDELFQSVSNGKGLIASAITDKGVETLADATFATIAENISNIAARDLSVIYSALNKHGLGVSGKEDEKKIAKIIQDLLSLAYLSQDTGIVEDFTDSTDNTIHENAFIEGTIGKIPIEPKELLFVNNTDYIEFEEITKSEYVTSILLNRR